MRHHNTEAKTMSVTKARQEWMKQNTVCVTIRLNNHTDADILAALNGKAKQTEIKRLIRLGMAAEQNKE